ncbi:hypothetical protein QN277_000588 [Acacia crassicarpa]|uniref:Uncharacterized protein n=1 Tax=Acacia crassicarpa TaxID=499986 RepID=A0AAE1N6R7_9FABA|nr:hypothetical protein QN277_000587 [Acacia crassicarpa]KAK4283661.1 hypothetical protein QN277_000588 [Acacia crassicarpa]
MTGSGEIVCWFRKFGMKS